MLSNNFDHTFVITSQPQWAMLYGPESYKKAKVISKIAQALDVHVGKHRWCPQIHQVLMEMDTVVTRLSMGKGKSNDT